MGLPYLSDITEYTLAEFNTQGYSDADVLDMSQNLLLAAIPCLETLYTTMTDMDKKDIKYAVLEMAKYIKIDFSNFNRATSPYSSETIGSYSYSKLQDAVRGNQPTKVPAFDRAVARFAPLCGVEYGTSMAATSEQVFKPGFEDFLARREGRFSPDGSLVYYEEGMV